MLGFLHKVASDSFATLSAFGSFATLSSKSGRPQFWLRQNLRFAQSKFSSKIQSGFRIPPSSLCGEGGIFGHPSLRKIIAFGSIFLRVVDPTSFASLSPVFESLPLRIAEREGFEPSIHFCTTH